MSNKKKVITSENAQTGYADIDVKKDLAELADARENSWSAASVAGASSSTSSASRGSHRKPITVKKRPGQRAPATAAEWTDRLYAKQLAKWLPCSDPSAYDLCVVVINAPANSAFLSVAPSQIKSAPDNDTIIAVFAWDVISGILSPWVACPLWMFQKRYQQYTYAAGACKPASLTDCTESSIETLQQAMHATRSCIYIVTRDGVSFDLLTFAA